MLISELDLTPTTQRVLEAMSIEETDSLRRPADELLAAPGITGTMLHEIVCRMSAYRIPLPESDAALRADAPTEIDLEMLRLWLVDGASLREIGTAHKIDVRQVQQRLREYFGLTGKPAAVVARNHKGRRPKLERLIALRLCRAEGDMPISLIVGALSQARPSEVNTAIASMASKGMLTITGDDVEPTAKLRGITRWRKSTGTRRGTCPATAAME